MGKKCGAVIDIFCFFDQITKRGILDFINEKNIQIKIFKKLDSTNEFLKKNATDNTAEGTVVIALSQTKGRGRMARKFFSPKGSGIYMSIFLKPTLKAEKSMLITAAAAVAVSEACEALGSDETEIKWVNDVLINGKKVCGILTEGSIDTKSGKFENAIVGIGVNVYHPKGDFCQEIRGVAGAVFDKNTKGLKNRLIAEIIERFMKYYAEIEQKTFLEVYRKRSAVIGKNITVLKGENSFEATAIGIDDNCRLQVKYPDGSEEFLGTGEISVRLS